ncbi:hypothetical protein [Polymorphospora rubra]|uniref:hypothetical protein n=1 Tax=Polymorphospora rubra TaxID=338584 RepID=UPI001BB3F402|nr:hypothetical protein [Polymorphospora rubra]
MAISDQSQSDPRAELFDPDEDCSTHEPIGGDPEGRCGLVQRCTLRCHIRYLDGEDQDNDWLVNT